MKPTVSTLGKGHGAEVRTLPASVIFVVHLPREPARIATYIVHDPLSLEKHLLHYDVVRLPTKIGYEAKWQRLLARAHFDA